MSLESILSSQQPQHHETKHNEYLEEYSNDSKASTESEGNEHNSDMELNSLESSSAVTKQTETEFIKAFHKYYVDPSCNSNGNFDNYLTNALNLINSLPKSFPNKTQIHSIAQKLQLPKENLNNVLKKTIILDLDETLIHSDLDNVYADQHDALLYFDTDDDGVEEKDVAIPLIIRPGMYEFLEYLSSNFEVFVFTASCKSYADAILNYIEKDKKYFDVRLYREHCLFLEPGLYIKDLSILAQHRQMESVIIIDNSIFSFANQLDNGILITSFYNDKSDSLLSNVQMYLDSVITKSLDIRKNNRDNFMFDLYRKNLLKNKLSIC